MAIGLRLVSVGTPVGAVELVPTPVSVGVGAWSMEVGQRIEFRRSRMAAC